MAWTGASPHLEEGADRLHLEGYARFTLLPGLEITPDLQWVRHSGLKRKNGDLWVGGIRITFVF
jgi:carbohydrate-selective porin OprB